MDGVVNILKPPGMTSSDVVMWLRRALKLKKIGHTGTLDPGVVGVLPLCLGNATRLAEYLTEEGKAYRAEITFGIKTDSQDSYGKVIHSAPVTMNEQEFKKILPTFLGTIRQVPPMYSAVRIGGKHLYEYARQGVEIERVERTVQVFRLELLEWEAGEYPRAVFDVECSKGTYIRTLCADIGEALGCGAYMSYLLRTRSGLLKIHDSWTIEEIERCLAINDFSFIVSPSTVLSLPSVKLPYYGVSQFLNGLPTDQMILSCDAYLDNQYVQVLEESKLIGIGVWRNAKLYPHKVFKH
ncbi:MAG: tRNA pseudouridine(55) synthase TruB [Desulfitobacterium hafniense]|nr:tRNA pseudouridine(55) synthase TruB [Desulfitobacterium hafniense]